MAVGANTVGTLPDGWACGSERMFLYEGVASTCVCYELVRWCCLPLHALIWCSFLHVGRTMHGAPTDDGGGGGAWWGAGGASRT